MQNLLSTVDMSPNLENVVIFPNSAEEHSICDAVNAIVSLALLNRKIVDISVAYDPEVEGLSVKVFKAGTNYFGVYKPIYKRNVYLDQPSSHLQLQTLEDALIDLVADAKDKLMGAV